jgi:hypothetical protein
MMSRIGPHAVVEGCLLFRLAHGVQLGNSEQAKENKREADRYAKTLRPILIELRHLPVGKIADELTKQKVATPRGGRWHGRTVARLLDRLHLR